MLIALFLTSFTPSAHAADGATLDPSLMETEVVRQGIELQELKAERDSLAAQCATRCKSATPAKPKATTAPKPAPTASTPSIDPHTAEIEALKAEIAELREALRAEQTRPIIVNVAPTPVNVNVAAPNVEVNPTVERHTEHTETFAVQGFRFHGGLGEMVIGAPPLPGSNLSAVDATEVFARGELAVSSRGWIMAEVGASYGFAQDATGIRGLVGYARNVGPVDINVGAGPAYRCTAAFTEGDLCTNSLFGGQGQLGIAFHAYKRMNVEVFGGGGYSAVDSKVAGPGGTSYGYGGARFFFGEVGETETVPVD